MTYDDVGPVREPKKRRWWIALILMVLGGGGYLYVGKPKRYALYFIVSVLFVASIYHGLWGRLADPVVFLSVTAVSILVTLGFWADGVRLAVGQPDYELRGYNRWWIYALCFVAMMVLSSLNELSFGKIQQGARSFSIPAGSMAPAMLVGDIVVADTRAYQSADPQRGDVVIFRLPKDPSIDYTKRVIALPGERVQMVDGIVRINGEAVPQQSAGEAKSPDGGTVTRYMETLPGGVSHMTQSILSNAPGDNTPEYTVPEGHYFVLGDNRDNSSDSRFNTEVGFVPRENIYARVGGVIWSKDWGRMGLRVK